MNNLYNIFKCIIALILWLNGLVFGSVLNGSNSNELAAAGKDAPNILMKRLSSAAQQVQQVNCTTEAEDCEDSKEIPFICWIQVAGISVSFCLFLVCYIQYRLRVRSKQFKSQILM